MSIEIDIGVNTNDTLTLDEEDIESLNPVKTHSGVGDFSASIAGNRAVEEYAKRQDRINIKSDGTTFFTGYLLKVSHNKQRGTTRIQGRGIGKRLQETRPDYDALGGSLTYTNIALQDAIDNYWSRTPFSATVTDQTTSTVNTNDQAASVDTTNEWTDDLTIANTDPLTIDNGKLKLLQSNELREAENALTRTAGGISRTDFSGGNGIKFNGGDSATFDIDYDYTVDNPTIYIRAEEISSGDFTTLEVYDSNGNQLTGGLQANTSLGWVSESISGNLSDNTLTLEPNRDLPDPDNDGVIENNFGEVDVDVVAFVDDNFSYTFDNSLNTSSGYLDGPELYPPSFTIETQDYTTSLNIGKADLNTTFNDTTENQELGVSFDSGGTFTRSSNTNSLTASSSSATRSVRGELTLSKYPLRSNAQSATPRFGYNGQTVDSFEVLVDTNDLTVIDELELSKNHFDNLQTLHDYGDFLWVIEHDSSDIGNLTVNSFERGDETRTLPSLTDNDINKTPKVDSSQYYNSIFVQGALVSGSRPTAEVKDSTAISNDGREISPGVLRDLDVLTEGGAAFRAQALLDKAQRNSELRGQKVTPAVDLSPGYAYAVDFGDGLKEFTAEEVSISKGTDRAETTLDFIPRSDISQDIAELRRNARKTQDQV